MIPTDNLQYRLKQHPGISEETTVGVVSSFGKGAEVVTKGDRTRDIVAVLTTSDIDLEDEVLVPEGADLSYFRRNGVIFADHQYDMTDYVGDLRAITPMYGVDKATIKGWKIRFHVCDGLMGQTVQKIVEHRGKIGISIGFKTVDYGPLDEAEKRLYTQNGKVPRSIVRAYEAFEGSTTLLPCNVTCQSIGSSDFKSITKSAQIEELLHDVDDLVRLGIITREAAARLGMPITPKRKVFAVSSPVASVKVFDWGSVRVKG